MTRHSVLIPFLFLRPIYIAVTIRKARHMTPPGCRREVEPITPNPRRDSHTQPNHQELMSRPAHLRPPPHQKNPAKPRDSHPYATTTAPSQYPPFEKFVTRYSWHIRHFLRKYPCHEPCIIRDILPRCSWHGTNGLR
jgi:hypothetical protein